MGKKSCTCQWEPRLLLIMDGTQCQFSLNESGKEQKHSNMEGERGSLGHSISRCVPLLAFEAVSGWWPKWVQKTTPSRANPQIQSVVPTGKLSFLLFSKEADCAVRNIFMVICQCSASEIGPLWFYVLFYGGELACKEGSCCSHTTD